MSSYWCIVTGNKLSSRFGIRPVYHIGQRFSGMDAEEALENALHELSLDYEKRNILVGINKISAWVITETGEEVFVHGESV